MNPTSLPLETVAVASPRTRTVLGVWARLRVGFQALTLGVVSAPLWWPLLFTTKPIYQGTFAASRMQLGSWSIPMADPFTALTVLAASAALPWSLSVGALIIFTVYLLARGRSFCAYACPLHLVLEHWDRLLVRFGLRRELIGEAWPRWLNVAIAILLLAASALTSLPLFETVNPINALVRTLQSLALPGLGLVAAVMLLEAVAGRRVFCRHLCPLGGFYSAVNRAGVAGVAVDPDTCTGCRKCTQHCLAAPELLDAIRRARAPVTAAPAIVESSHCTLCLDCAAACEHASIRFVNRWQRHPNPQPPALP